MDIIKKTLDHYFTTWHNALTADHPLFFLGLIALHVVGVVALQFGFFIKFAIFVFVTYTALAHLIKNFDEIVDKVAEAYIKFRAWTKSYKQD